MCKRNFCGERGGESVEMSWAESGDLAGGGAVGLAVIGDEEFAKVIAEILGESEGGSVVRGGFGVEVGIGGETEIGEVSVSVVGIRVGCGAGEVEEPFFIIP